MLTEYLDETREFVVSTAADLEAADKILANEDAHFDAVILDIGLPDGDGATTARGCGGKDTACRSSC